MCWKPQEMIELEVQTTEQKQLRRKRRIGLLAGLFVGLLLFFTLFSNTLLALTLPKVATEAAGKGQLAHTYQGSATVKPVEEADLMNPAGWKVSKVLVKEGDAVHKGQTLVTYNSSEAKQQIEDDQAALKKLKLSMDQLEYNYIQASQSEDHAAVLNAQAAIESAKIDISTQEQHIQNQQENLEVNQELVAPFDGIVTSVHASESLPSTGGPDIRLSNTGQGFQFELQIPAGIASMLTIGESLDVTLHGKDSRIIQGRIAKLEEALSVDDNSENVDNSGATGLSSSPGTNLLFVTTQDKTLKGGERVQVNLSLSKGQNEDPLLISSKAIRKDSSGTYVLTIEERNGPLGNVYYAARRSITISDSNDYQTAISSGLFDQDQVIVDSSEPLQDGSRVRL